MSTPHTPTLAQVLREADDIAKETSQPLSTGHVLLAFYTVPNRAEVVLRDSGIDEDRLLEVIQGTLSEPRSALEEVDRRAQQVAASCGAGQLDCLHYLVAMSRSKPSVAHELLELATKDLAQLRTRALAILTGAIPRWAREEEVVPAAESALPAAREPIQRPLHSSLPAKRSPRRPGKKPEWNPPLIPPKRPSTNVRRPIGLLDPTRRPAKATPAPRRPERVERVERPAESSLPPMPSSRPPAVDHRWALPRAEYPWLSSLGRNLSAAAARGELDVVVGREKEIGALIDILGKRRANNPCLIGEPGVGKTALVEGLALALIAEPGPLSERVIVALDVGSLLIGTHLRGSFSEKLQGIKEEVARSDGRVIVFFDELHTLVGVGASGDGALDAASELKSALARGQFPCIGATTPEEWTRHLEPDPALKRRFHPVLVAEPSPEAALKWIERIIEPYAAHHRVRFPTDTLKAAIDLSVRFITDRHLPDKALALLDLAGSRAARAAEETVTRERVAEIVAERAGLPVERVLSSDRRRLLDLERLLAAEIVGHEAALGKIAGVVRRHAAGFGQKRPRGSFLFLGPSGVGKTQTAKAIAKILHGSDDALITFDLTEFAEAHSVSRLIGAPPGYVGHEAGGQLTEAVRKRPGSVLLLDEIEKAHREVLQVLLQILDEGRLTDGHGRSVSFTETLVVMTSNLGADMGSAGRSIGFVDAAGQAEALESRVLDTAKKRLAPELWGRIDEKLVFHPLTPAQVRRVVVGLAEASSVRLERERGIRFALDDAALSFVVREGGAEAQFGARPLRAVLARIIEAPIAARILEGRLHAGESVLVSTRPDGSLAFLVGEDRTSLSQRPAKYNPPSE